MQEKKIDWTAITKQTTTDARVEAAESEIDRVGYVCLTDALVNRGAGGQVVLEKLDPGQANGKLPPLPGAAQRRYKLRALRDQWGNPRKPGDVIVFERELPLRDRAGRKIGAADVSRMKRDGSFAKRYIERREYVLDDRCCFDCEYDVAITLLDTAGVHYETNAGLCRHREVSASPVRVHDEKGRPVPVIDEDGRPSLDASGRPRYLHKHVWYWLYAECPPWIYEQLPRYSAPDEDTVVSKPVRRGRGKKSPLDTDAIDGAVEITEF